MAANLRARPLYLLTAILTTWSVAQFWLCWHAVRAINITTQLEVQRLEASHGGLILHVRGLPSGLWMRAGLESVAGVALPTIVGLCLVAGGRRWLAAAVAAYPLANVLGGFHEGAALGLGWQQPVAFRNWFAYGVVIDTLLLVLVVGLLVSAMPERGDPVPTRWAFTRVIPVVIVLAGWWVTRHPTPDGHDWVWLGDAVTFVVVAGLLADSALPFAARALAIGVVLPLSTGTILNDLIAPHQIGFPAVYFLHHTLIALATAVYVVGVPSAVQWFRAARTAGVTATA
ncbi:MAG TPA: hypothetical protein VHV76_10345 [Mycobacteriales bacterium]|nr:hypothetical protein [Mycobacteriales bacterium]